MSRVGADAMQSGGSEHETNVQREIARPANDTAVPDIGIEATAERFAS